VIDTKEKKLRCLVKKQKMKELELEGFCNSNYAGDKNTRRSVTSYAIYIFGNLVAWKSNVEIHLVGETFSF
jgi:hypothetical protein